MKLQRTCFEISCWRAAGFRQPRVHPAPVFCTQRSSCAWNRFLFCIFIQEFARNCHKKFVFQVELWHLTTVHILYHKNWSQKRDSENVKGLNSLWQNITTVDHGKAPTCYHTTENRAWQSTWITKRHYRHARDCTSPTAVTFTRWYQSHVQEMHLYANKRQKQPTRDLYKNKLTYELKVIFWVSNVMDLADDTLEYPFLSGFWNEKTGGSDYIFEHILGLIRIV